MHAIYTCLSNTIDVLAFSHVVIATGYFVIQDEEPSVRVAPTASSSSSAVSAAAATHPAPRPDASRPWSCDACTVLNQSAAVKCEVCHTPRPVPASVPAIAPAPQSMSYWACPQCTLENNIARSRCNACGASAPALAAAPASATAGTVPSVSPLASFFWFLSL
jgi:hypothetical protein